MRPHGEACMKPFPTGFWNYVPIRERDAKAVKEWADAGMTLAMGPRLAGARPDGVVSRRRRGKLSVIR